MPLPNWFRPNAGSYGVQLIETDAAIGTGALAVGNSTTTSYVLPCPRRIAILGSLTINAMTAITMSSGTGLLQVFKRDNSGTPADRTLTGTISIASDVIVTAQKSYAITITGSQAFRTLASGDFFRIDVVTTGSVSVQPLLRICAIWDVIK